MRSGASSERRGDRTPALLHLNRRQLLGSSAVVLLAWSAGTARSAIVKGGLPWKPGAADPPTPVSPEGWHYFTPQEGTLAEAFVDRLIPADERGITYDELEPHSETRLASSGEIFREPALVEF